MAHGEHDPYCRTGSRIAVQEVSAWAPEEVELFCTLPVYVVLAYAIRGVKILNEELGMC